MQQMPASVRPMLRRLRRRLAIGAFLDRWPRWAAAGLLAAGVVVLVCRMFFPGAADRLPWLWLTPILVAAPIAVVGWRRAYRPAEIVAIADWLGGGRGTLMTLFERHDPAWAESPVLAQAAAVALPRLRPWRQLALVPVAAAFLLAAQWLPQRTRSGSSHAPLAQQIAADLAKTVEALKQEQLITPAEEQRLEEEIERIRRDAEQRVDASTWEAADALREQVAAELAEKRDALQWARDSLQRHGAAVQAHGAGSAQASAASAELRDALAKLAERGMMPAGAAEKLQGLLKNGLQAADAAALAALLATMGEQMSGAAGRLANARGQGQNAGRFDPSEFPLDGKDGQPGGVPGRGGVTRGRADASMTWGKESQPLDRFKSQTLPPGTPRSPDDWAPVVELPGMPEAAARASAAAAARAYGASAGQGAWRRSLAPRHQTAVKKYFGK